MIHDDYDDNESFDWTGLDFKGNGVSGMPLGSMEMLIPNLDGREFRETWIREIVLTRHQSQR